MTTDELLTQLERIASTNDEVAYKNFVLEHFTELPEEVQSKVVMGFYSETLEKEAAPKIIAAIQEDGIAAIEALERIKNEATKTE